ncbi:phage tail protein, partial [Salmonella enterica]|nr:phage tail protein [Salmonella enterica]
DIDLTDKSCRLNVSGRDKTGDLVDSSAIHGSGQWKRARLEQIVRDICKPFGIEVLVQTDTGDAIDSFSLDDGEKAFDAIDRAARAKAILVTSS